MLGGVEGHADGVYPSHSEALENGHCFVADGLHALQDGTGIGTSMLKRHFEVVDHGQPGRHHPGPFLGPGPGDLAIGAFTQVVEVGHGPPPPVVEPPGLGCQFGDLVFQLSRTGGGTTRPVVRSDGALAPARNALHRAGGGRPGRWAGPGPPWPTSSG